MRESGSLEALAPTVSDASRFREQVDVFCQRAILLVVLGILVWAPLAMGAARFIDFVPVQILTALALGLWVVRFWAQRPFRLFWSPICWGVYAFVGYALVRARFVEIPFAAHREMFQVVVYGILFLVIANNLNRRDSAEIVTTTLIVLGMGLSLFAIYQFATHSVRMPFYSWAFKPEQYANRGSGTFINPNNFAGFLEMLIPLGLSCVLLSRMSATVKVLLAYAILVMIAGLCVSLSRGAMLATVAASALLCVALLFEGGYVLPSLLALLLLGGGAMAVRSHFESIDRRFNDLGSSGKMVNDRRFYWQVAEEIFHEHEMWGAGPAQFDQQFFLHQPEQLLNRIVYAHNEYLNTLADWGAAGLAIVAAFATALFYGAWRAWRNVRRNTGDIGRRQTDKGAFVLGATCGLIALLLHCSVDFDMHSPADALLAVALMALLTAHGRFITERYWKNPGNIGKIVLGLAVLAAMVGLLTTGFKQAAQQRWVERADAQQRILKRPINPDDVAGSERVRKSAYDSRIAALKNAYELDPTDPEVCYNLGECYWDVASQGARGYEQNTLKAMQWYSRAMLANPLDQYACLQFGICLDWLNRHAEAGPYFERARTMHPNSWYAMFCKARHLVEINQLPQARELFILAYYHSRGSPMAMDYVRMVDERLSEAAKK